MRKYLAGFLAWAAEKLAGPQVWQVQVTAADGVFQVAQRAFHPDTKGFEVLAWASSVVDGLEDVTWDLVGESEPTFLKLKTQERDFSLTPLAICPVVAS